MTRVVRRGAELGVKLRSNSVPSSVSCTYLVASHTSLLTFFGDSPGANGVSKVKETTEAKHWFWRPPMPREQKSARDLWIHNACSGKELRILNHASMDFVEPEFPMPGGLCRLATWRLRLVDSDVAECYGRCSSEGSGYSTCFA